MLAHSIGHINIISCQRNLDFSKYKDSILNWFSCLSKNFYIQLNNLDISPICIAISRKDSIVNWFSCLSGT